MLAFGDPVSVAAYTLFGLCILAAIEGLLTGLFWRPVFRLGLTD
jgi:hypothetical protein